MSDSITNYDPSSSKDEGIASRRRNKHGDHQTLASFVEIPFAYWRTILSFLACSLLVGWLAIMLLPRSYDSEARVMVLVGRESVSLDPTVTTSQSLMMQKTQVEEVNSALQVITSRRVAELVVDDIGVDAILEGELPSEGEAVEPGLVKKFVGLAKGAVGTCVGMAKSVSGLSDAIGDRELAITSVMDSVEVHSPIKTTSISVYASSKTPAMAQAIAQATVDKFIEQHRLVNQGNDSKDFFAEQVEVATKSLAEAQDTKRTFMQDHNLVAIAETRLILKEQLTAIDRDLIVDNGVLQQSLAEEVSIVENLDSHDDEIVASTLEASDPTWSGMRQRVYELELLEKSQSIQFTPSHEVLISTREQLAGAKKILDSLKSQRTDQSTTPNPVKERIRDQLALLRTKISGLRSGIEKKTEQRETIVAEIQEFLNHESDVTRMEHRIAMLTNSLRSLESKWEESRVIDQIQNENHSNIRVFQPATFIERAASPNKKLLAAAFAMLGLIGGFSLAFVQDFFSSKLRTAERVEARLHVPVLGSVMKSKSVKLLGDPITDQHLYRECRAVVSRILTCQRDANRVGKTGCTVGVLALDEGSGASTIARSLAVTADQDFTQRTLLVDGDPRSRSLSDSFGLNGSPGLRELALGKANLPECVQRGSEPGIDIVSSSSSRLAQDAVDVAARVTGGALDEMKSGWDLVVVDLPPATCPDHPIALARLLDYVVLVVNSEESRESDADAILDCLSDCDAQVVGIVLNKCTNHLPKWIGRFLAKN